MIIKSAKFLVSNQTYKKCPVENIPEYAFIGRSNVGKSSLINMLTGYGKLAKISGRPGKTQLINHFLINEQWYLVDLPGYGYAKVSKENRRKFGKMITEYTLKRSNLMTMFVLIDSRIAPQKTDLVFIENLALESVPFVILFTKTDKLSAGKLKANIDAYEKELSKNWDELPKIIPTSATKKTGREQILSFIEETNCLFQE